MKCPICDENMKEIEKNNVTLDICPGCKGVWLDRGELEKLMEFAAVTAMQESSPSAIVSQVAALSPNAPSQLLQSPNQPFDPRNRRELRDEYRHHGHHDDKRYGFGNHREHDDDHQYGQQGNHGPYQKRKSWISNVFEMFGGDD